MGPIGFALAVVGATTLVVNVMVPGLAASAYRAYDDYQNAAASGSDHPLFRAMAVTLGRSTGLTEGYEALTGRDAVTDRALTMDERDDRLAESANSVGGELGAGVGAFAVRRTLGTGFCFVAGTLVAMTSTAYAQPIEDVRVGDRVEVTSEQESTCSHEAREDQVRVSFVFANERASWDTVYLDKLVSRDEAESLGYEVGASVWVDGTDFGAAGWAQVSAVEPVHVEAGAGCVVYATVEHQNGELVRVDLSDGSEVLGTAGHRYWSVTRGGWFEARELREGEALRTPSGVVHVTSSLVIDALAPVFNIEVEGAHEYFVGEGEVLVHNGIDCGRQASAADALEEEVGYPGRSPAEAMGDAYETRTTPSGDTLFLHRSQGGTGPRRWQRLPQAPSSTRLHGNSANAPYAELYVRTDSNGQFQKWGISQNAATRYTRAELAHGEVRVLRTGTRREMLALERRLTGSRPGPLNFERWAGFRRPGHPNFDPNWRTR
jgi:hypothetical protein